jgi:hypothetical protein
MSSEAMEYLLKSEVKALQSLMKLKKKSFYYKIENKSVIQLSFERYCFYKVPKEIILFKNLKDLAFGGIILYYLQNFIIKESSHVFNQK